MTVHANRSPVDVSYNAVIPFFVPSAPVRKGVDLAFRARAAAGVDSSRGRSGERLKRLGRGIDIDLMPRLERGLIISRGTRKGENRCRQLSHGFVAIAYKMSDIGGC